MYKIITLLIAFAFVVSCKEETKPSTPLTETEKTTTTQEATTEAEKAEANIVVTTEDLTLAQEQFLSITIAYFKNCKANSADRNDCRSNITKMISEFYQISDFNDAKGEHVMYDSIYPTISKSDAWTKLGNANDQEVLQKAQEAANNGKATIAIDISESYGQVAMITPGKLTTSNSWKLEVPNATALVDYDAEKSFMNKPLSYAFKSTENIVLFSKK
ncbi:hypothetical protein IMCC3317_18520 [Kordia antarctica]|uniref:Uncharacterized protein n=1 Tax=Kordia antarctica TaxID=1218801 RepID=A0A7L4ZJA6_9FLAO|nr:hypothetical protein [Kordia antarctica]QHI36489.1 hypothetical protein IMCC3317_18520 [Kordia antarctica]